MIGPFLLLQTANSLQRKKTFDQMFPRATFSQLSIFVLFKILTFFFVGLAPLGASQHTVSNLNDAGAGSLREALTLANAADDVSTIRFAENVRGQILLDSPLTASAPVVIEGPGKGLLALDGQNAVRILTLTGSSLSTPHLLSGLTFQNGSATLGGANLRVTGSIDLQECAILGGTATAINGANNNSNNADGGGLYHSTGRLRMSHCLIENNRTIGGFSQGGGFYTERGTAEIDHCRIVGNTTDGFVAEGGGLGSRSVMTIENCEISFNETLASSSGGGGVYSDTAMTLRHCTLSNNTVGATPGTGVEGYSVGGGFANVGGLTLFEHCTLTENSAPHGQGQGAGISSLSASPIRFFSCIIANNGEMLPGENPPQDLDETPNRRITYEDLGFNIFGTVTNTNLNDPSQRRNTSQYEVDVPLLSTLAFHGGATRSHVPLPNSPALDVAGLPLPSQSFDQRGIDFPRVSGLSIDAGATERQDFQDSDLDSIPDAVESVVPGLADSGGDLDGDGASDSREYLLLGISAISDPLQRPCLEIEPGASPAQWVLTFPFSINRDYRLRTNSDLSAPFTPVTTEFFTFADDSIASLSATSLDEREFFSLEAQVPAEPVN